MTLKRKENDSWFASLCEHAGDSKEAYHKFNQERKRKLHALNENSSQAEVRSVVESYSPDLDPRFRADVESLAKAEQRQSAAWDDFFKAKEQGNAAAQLDAKTRALRAKAEVNALRLRVNYIKDNVARIWARFGDPSEPGTEWKDEHLGVLTRTHTYKPNTLEWLKARENTLGGSDIGPIYEYLEHPGQWTSRNLERIRESKRPHNDSYYEVKPETGALFRGTQWEPQIARQYIEEHPEEQFFHTKDQWSDGSPAQINLDGITQNRKTGEMGVLEIKTSSKPEDWANGKIPVGYRAQGLFYLAKINGGNEPPTFTHVTYAVKVNDSTTIMTRRLEWDDVIDPDAPHPKTMQEFIPQAMRLFDMWQKEDAL